MPNEPKLELPVKEMERVAAVKDANMRLALVRGGLESKLNAIGRIYRPEPKVEG